MVHQARAQSTPKWHDTQRVGAGHFQPGAGRVRLLRPLRGLPRTLSSRRRTAGEVVQSGTMCESLNPHTLPCDLAPPRSPACQGGCSPGVTHSRASRGCRYALGVQRLLSASTRHAGAGGEGAGEGCGEQGCSCRIGRTQRCDGGRHLGPAPGSRHIQRSGARNGTECGCSWN